MTRNRAASPDEGRFSRLERLVDYPLRRIDLCRGLMGETAARRGSPQVNQPVCRSYLEVEDIVVFAGTSVGYAATA
ncbi:hypothetical protein [Amycolatopsis circi]|uniref:hypothetical protein n=1 Tax=Amycolatopsis circi TaxID=871959 RepID=UPI000E23EB99|nr:hypothetical protein [Amycolatopsis circi]